MANIEPRLSRFGSTLSWLLAREVPSGRLGRLFGTTPENIRAIAFRFRHRAVAALPEKTKLECKPDGELAQSVGVRSALDDAAWTPDRSRKLEWLMEQVSRTVLHYSTQYDFLTGARQLRRLLPYIGYAGDSRRIALQGFVHQQIAWFLVHSGRCVSAHAAAAAAQDLWRIAWHETGSKEYAQGFCEAALIASNALLLSRRPEEAQNTLDLARDAASAISAPLGSEHFRQAGVVLLQLRHDEKAAEQFRKSAEQMERLREAAFPVQVLMAGVRHSNILNPSNCEESCEMLSTVETAFGKASLETAMTLNWTAASCLSSGSPALIKDAVARLTDFGPIPAAFGHQATIRNFLLLTPELGLDDRLRLAWIRRVLYENPFRDS